MQLFQPLEATETMRTYIAHSMDGNGELLVSLEMTKSEVDVARKLAEEGAYLLRKVDEENETYQAEACQLAEEKATMAIEKEKTKEKFTRLRQELQDLQAGFATQNEDLCGPAFFTCAPTRLARLAFYL